jgi:hypothetical protein
LVVLLSVWLLLSLLCRYREVHGMAVADKTYSTREFARFLGIEEWQLNDLLRRWKLAEPPRIAGRRVWTKANEPAARAAIAENAK